MSLARANISLGAITLSDQDKWVYALLLKAVFERFFIPFFPFKMYFKVVLQR